MVNLNTQKGNLNL